MFMASKWKEPNPSGSPGPMRCHPDLHQLLDMQPADLRCMSFACYGPGRALLRPRSHPAQLRRAGRQVALGRARGGGDSCCREQRITGCAGIYRHVVANERVVQEGRSESILAPNLAVNIVKVLIEA